MSISYTPTTWADGADGGTPITAARLNNIESGVTNATKQANANANSIKTLGDSVSQATDYSFATLTLGSAASSGTIYRERLGRLVVIHVNAIKFSANIAIAENHDKVLASGAPAPYSSDPVYMITSSSGEVRVKITSGGDMVMHWSNATAGVEYSGLIAYVAQG